MAVKISTQLKKQGVTPRAGEGNWAKFDAFGNGVVMEFIKSNEHPGGENWYPLYPASRVTGASYQPYRSGTEWAEFANRAMADEANSNFRRRNSY
jgi:hypothetical protein